MYSLYSWCIHVLLKNYFQKKKKKKKLMITVTWCNNQVKSSNIFFLNFEYMLNSFAIVNFFHN